MQSTQSNSVDSVQNKGLLWATLQESGAFAGLARDQFQPVQSAFDRAVQQAAQTMSGSVSLSDANKGIIREFVQVLRSVRNPIPTPNQNNNNNAPKKKKIEMVYRADDLKNERANEFERQLREKQTEMDSFLTLKKPADVNFTDTAVDEDKPIGDEMSRLIAQELAARERELVQLKPEDIARAQQWIGTDTNATNATNATNVAKKSVSFLEENEQIVHDETTNELSDGDKFEETESIFSKFKKIKDETDTTDAAVTITMQQLYNKLIELEQRMDANHAEIMEHLNSKGGVIGAQCLAP